MKGCLMPEAVKGKEAVEAASAHCPEINPVLIDLRMPAVTGVEAARRVRGQSETCRVPVVAMSAHCEGGRREGARAAGAAGRFSEPIDFALLDETLGRATHRDVPPHDFGRHY
jgi:CheY-like chemotaxis protein